MGPSLPAGSPGMAVCRSCRKSFSYTSDGKGIPWFCPECAKNWHAEAPNSTPQPAATGPVAMTAEELAAAEERLAEIKESLQAGEPVRKAGVEMGALFVSIHDGHGYQYAGHTTFTDYVRALGYKPDRVQEMMDQARAQRGRSPVPPAPAKSQETKSQAGEKSQPPAAPAGPVLVSLADIVVDERIQLQARKLHVDKVEEYTEALEGGAVFPPVVVYRVDGHLVLADGFHRLAAYKALNRVEIPIEERPGTYQEARLYAATANARHGLVMSAAEKQEAGGRLIQETALSDSEIARKLAVNQTTVSRWRLSYANAEDSPAERTVTRGDQTYTLNPAGIQAAAAFRQAAQEAARKAAQETEPPPVDEETGEVQDARARDFQQAAKRREQIRAREERIIPVNGNGKHALDLVVEDEPVAPASATPERHPAPAAEPTRRPQRLARQDFDELEMLRNRKDNLARRLRQHAEYVDKRAAQLCGGDAMKGFSAGLEATYLEREAEWLRSAAEFSQYGAIDLGLDEE